VGQSRSRELGYSSWSKKGWFTLRAVRSPSALVLVTPRGVREKVVLFGLTAKGPSVGSCGRRSVGLLDFFRKEEALRVLQKGQSVEENTFGRHLDRSPCATEV